MVASISQSPFGVTSGGQQVDVYTLKSPSGLVARLIPFGATLVDLLVPDAKGRNENVVLGFDKLADYEINKPYLGSVIGRVSNRIGGARFTLEGKEYRLAANNGPNTLHGGQRGFNKVLWETQAIENPDAPGIRFTYASKDGEENFPGNVMASATYTLTPDRAVKIEYSAVTDKTTLVNLTNHSYFNLSGRTSRSILEHVLELSADRYTPTDKQLIPTGEILSVKETPLDFTSRTPIGKRIAEAGGYDLNFVLNGGGGKLAFAARAADPASGRVMEAWTTERGIQFYTGNFLDGPFQKHQAFCLEAQAFPDAPNHANFPSIVLRPGQTYSQTTIYKFV